MLSFDAAIRDTNSESLRTITIKVTSTIKLLNTGLFSERFQDSLVVLKVSNQVRHELDPQSFFMINYGNTLGNYIPKEGVLFSISGNTYGIIEVNLSKLKNSISLIPSTDHQIIHESDLIPQDVSYIPFSMKPPSVLPAPTKAVEIVSPEHVTDPLSYIKSKYYDILYSTSIPLSYFPKAALSRFKVLSENKSTIKVNLFKILLSIDQLNARHDGKSGLLKELDGSTESLDKEFEVKNQNEFIAGQNLLNDNEKLTVIVLQLKLRESQLQIIILLDLIVTMELIEQDFLFNNHPIERPKKKQSRPSLVRRKNQPKKIIPTFLGMGVGLPSKEIEQGSKTDLEEIHVHDLLITLDLLIERLRLLDTLYTEKTNTLVNFVAYVLVPYFNSQLPLTIKYIVDKIKDLNLKLNVKPKKIPRPTLRLKPSTKKFDRPKLLAPTLDDQTFAPKMLFKKSNSNLSSKNLQRRQVDFSVPVNRLKSMTEMDKSSVFIQSKKIKKPKLTDTNSFSQVMATPVKNKRPVQSNNPGIVNLPPIQNDVFLSPINERKTLKPLNTPKPIESSPSVIVSSERKKKPGEPIEIINSPFLDSLRGSSINGSPIAYDDNRDGESIFKRSKRKLH